MSMLSLFAHESMIASFCDTDGEAYGAECDVVTITNSPACLHAANAFSNAPTRSASPLVSSISKHTPWKPASLMASIPTCVRVRVSVRARVSGRVRVRIRVRVRVRLRVDGFDPDLRVALTPEVGHLQL